MRRTLLLYAAGAVTLMLASCSAGDVAGVDEPGVRETRSQNEINGFFNALDDKDWKAACSHLTQEGFVQIARAKGDVPLSGCPRILELLSKVSDPEARLGRVTVTSAEP
ncbi:MAG: hypothetical protein ACXWEF_03320, partial [Solirubrobacterales bacterium]